MAKKFKTRVGDPSGQTSWEYLVLYASLVLWASQHLEGLRILGDNLASLGGIINLRGKSVLNVITKEIAWRKVRCSWRYSAGHLPSEMNSVADALSRLAAPPGAESCTFPECLRGAREIEPPDFDSLWVCS